MAEHSEKHSRLVEPWKREQSVLKKEKAITAMTANNSNFSIEKLKQITSTSIEELAKLDQPTTALALYCLISNGKRWTPEEIEVIGKIFIGYALQWKS